MRLYRIEEMDKKLLFALVVPEQPGKQGKPGKPHRPGKQGRRPRA